MSELQLPPSTVVVKIGAKEYTIKFPTNGQLIDIERMKIDMTGGTIKDMLFTPSSQQAWLLTQAIATFTVLVPDLKKDSLVSSLLDLDPYTSKNFVKEFVEVFSPWFRKWENVINGIVEEEVKKEEDAK